MLLSFPLSLKAIINGRLTNPTKHPEIRRIISKYKGKTISCTGTMITARVMLTAAHCISVKDLNKKLHRGVHKFYFDDSYQLIDTDSNIKAELAFISDNYFHIDAAIVIFPKTISYKYLKINFNSKFQRRHTPVTLIGYGLTDITDPKSNSDHLLYKGKNYIDSYYGRNYVNVLIGNFSSYGKNNRAMAAPGDSGGPLLNIFGEIIGIVSLIQLNRQKTKIIHSIYKTISSIPMMRFLNKTIRYSDLIPKIKCRCAGRKRNIYMNIFDGIYNRSNKPCRVLKRMYGLKNCYQID